MSPLVLRVCVLAFRCQSLCLSLFHGTNKLTQSGSLAPLLPFFMFVYVKGIAQNYDIRNSKANRDGAEDVG